jgi:hypothetical protein
MAVAALRNVWLQVTNGSSPIEGPYQFMVSSGAPATLGITLSTVDAWEEVETVGPWKNFNWSQISFVLGYRLHATLRFTAVESEITPNNYGLTLLHRLWRIGLENQITFAALEFRMFTTGVWRPVVVNTAEWRPTLMAGKQGFYEVEIPIVTRDLVAAPGEWAKANW